MISLRYMINLLALGAIVLFVCPVGAMATPAGSVVNNTATVKYSASGGADITITSSDSFTVQELLTHSLLWQDVTDVPVQSGDPSRVITYDLFNNGNGLDEYDLILNSSVSTDDFDPLAAIYLDINNSGTYDAADVLYNPGSVTPSFGEGEFLRIFVVANIPAGLTDGNRGSVELTAISNSVTLPVASGAIIAGAGDGGTDIVVAIDDATVTLEASFVVSTYVTMLKTFVVNSPGGGASPVPGATIEYTIIVSMAGAGTVDNLVITDPVPVNTTYLPGSILLDNIPKLDGLDTDEADYDVTTAGAVSVSLGTMVGGDPAREIRFTVTID